MVSCPRSEWVTSGWYWRPKILRSAFSMATTAPASDLPTHEKPSGSFTASSPWDIHTCWEASVSLPYRTEELTVCTGMRPYSAFSADLTSPPRRWTMSCMP